jgi:dihydroxyacetone kinase-like protein
MKKFVNDPRQFVPEMLEGIQLASDGRLKYEPKYNLIYRADMPKANKVSIIQGSGSGHEPAHTMIVGKGMLDAACPGDVFAGPPVEFVYETTKLLNSPMGVLHLVLDRGSARRGRQLLRDQGGGRGLREGRVARGAGAHRQ